MFRDRQYPVLSAINTKNNFQTETPHSIQHQKIDKHQGLPISANVRFDAQLRFPDQQVGLTEARAPYTTTREAFIATCPNCGFTGYTKPELVKGFATILASAFCVMMGCCLGCCLIPCWMDSLKDISHRCKQCNHLISLTTKI